MCGVALKELGPKDAWIRIYRREQFKRISFEDLVTLIKVAEDEEQLSEDRLAELYDFAEWFTGYKLERTLLPGYEPPKKSAAKFGSANGKKNNGGSSDLTSLTNIGQALSSRLQLAGIGSVAIFEMLTTEQIWDKLYANDPSAHYTEINAIEGAKKGVKSGSLSKKRKDELKNYVDRKKRIFIDAENLTTLPNIGKTVALRLAAVGINSRGIMPVSQWLSCSFGKNPCIGIFPDCVFLLPGKESASAYFEECGW